MELLNILHEIFPGTAEAHFAFYAKLLAGILVGVSAALFLIGLNPAQRERLCGIWRSFRPWFVMAPLIVLAMALGTKGVIVAFLLLSVFAIKEFARATGVYNDSYLTIALYAAAASFYVAAWIDWWNLFPAMAVYAIALLLLLPTLRNEYKGSIQMVGLGSFAILYFGWFLAHGAFLAQAVNGLALLFFIIIATECNDASAFLTGKFFGRRKLVSNVSPGKTVEGALGGLAGTTIFTLVCWNHLPGFTLTMILLTIPLVWLGGMAGDLVLSFIKRDLGVKDMGSLIPGHGGLLDRIDSLIFVVPLFTHLVNYFIGVADV